MQLSQGRTSAACRQHVQQMLKPNLLPSTHLHLGSPQRAVLARAQPEESSGDSSKSSSSNTDWDGAWKSFQKQVRSQVDFDPQTSRTSRPPPRRVQPLPGSPGGVRAPSDKIRKAERLLLDIWTNEDFLKVGVLGSVGLLIVFALVIGPPPGDGQCTAFWCGGYDGPMMYK